MDTIVQLHLRPLLRIATMLILGIVVGDACSGRVSPWLWLGLAAVSALPACWMGKRWARAQGACILVSTMWMGAALMGGELRRSGLVATGGAVDYEAVVMSEPVVRGRVVRCDMAITHVGTQPLSRPVSVKASLLRDTVLGRWQQLHLGDGIRARSRLEPLTAYYAGGNFDYVRWLRSHGVRSQTFIHHRHWQKAAVSLSPLPAADRLRLRALMLRRRLLERYRLLGLDRQQYAVVAAMTLGDKSEVSRDTKEAYSVSGASHVLALSGLHLGIIYAILTLLFGWGRRWRWLAQGMVLVAVWAFVVLVGLPPSAVRAATMLTICGLCILLGRQQVSVNTLAFAAIVMLAVHPSSLWDIGFQMSFMAVLAIVVYFKPLYHLLTLRNPLARWLWGLTVVSVAAQIGTAPIVAYYFGRFSCYFLLTNIVVIPAATLILYGAVGMLLATPFLPLQQALAGLLAHLATALNASIVSLARLPGASIEGIRIGLLQLMLIYIIIVSVTVIASYALKIRSQRRLEAFYNR